MSLVIDATAAMSAALEPDISENRNMLPMVTCSMCMPVRPKNVAANCGTLFETVAIYLRKGGWEMLVNIVGNLAAFVPLGFLWPSLRDGRTSAWLHRTVFPPIESTFPQKAVYGSAGEASAANYGSAGSLGQGLVDMPYDALRER